MSGQVSPIYTDLTRGKCIAKDLAVVRLKSCIISRVEFSGRMVYPF